jgi:hypothetical protein
VANSNPLEVDTVPIPHELMVVLTADCDLEQDYNARQRDDQDQNPNVIPYVLLCDLFTESVIKGNVPPGSDIWKRIERNQDERYHSLKVSVVAPDSSGYVDWIPDVFIDFRRPVPIPTVVLYDAVLEGSLGRRAIVPPVYLHDLMHRFFAYQSRVGVD